jgi:hypothetical protein
MRPRASACARAFEEWSAQCVLLGQPTAPFGHCAVLTRAVRSTRCAARRCSIQHDAVARKPSKKRRDRFGLSAVRRAQPHTNLVARSMQRCKERRSVDERRADGGLVVHLHAKVPHRETAQL